MRRVGGGLLLSLLLSACGSAGYEQQVLEEVRHAPLEFSVRSEGELLSTRPTMLTVPGPAWATRQLNWMLPDGSRVEKGQVLARFSAEQSTQDLTQARIDLDRNLLARASKQSELDQKDGQLGVDLIQVAVQYAIAERYANATLDAMARNDILDAVQDVHFLEVNQRILQWRKGQSAARGGAELAVLDAQRNSFDTVVKQKQADLEALELRAPHAGLMVLERDWKDEAPRVGASLYAGNSFASLPDLGALEVQLMVPQVEAQGIQPGDVVELHRSGMPAQRVTTTITWVASAAQPRSRVNPVKYLAMKAPVPAESAQAHGWLPGQRFVGRIILLRTDGGISVPNMALHHANGTDTVRVLDGARVVQRELTLGVRGPTRTQVLSGLKPGERILLRDRDAEETE